MEMTMLLKLKTDLSSENIVVYDFKPAEHEYGVRIFVTSNIQALVWA